MDKKEYKSPSIKVVETTIVSKICAGSELGPVSNEGFEQEEFNW